MIKPTLARASRSLASAALRAITGGEVDATAADLEAVANLLKTRHETAKNAIGNIR